MKEHRCKECGELVDYDNICSACGWVCDFCRQVVYGYNHYCVESERCFVDAVGYVECRDW